MIVYKGTKAKFQKDYLMGELVPYLQNRFNLKDSNPQVAAWRNSLTNMLLILNVATKVPDDAGIAIEYGVPGTGKRVDFIITGEDEQHDKNCVIIELKQWTSMEALPLPEPVITAKYDNPDDCAELNTAKEDVKTILGHTLVETPHPSYQAYTYAYLLNQLSSNVRQEDITLYPCAFLHNYRIKDNDPILAPQYEEWYSKAPVFTSQNQNSFCSFIESHISYGDNSRIIDLIENSPLSPSKSLQDSIVGMLRNNPEFMMIDEQMSSYSRIKNLVFNTWNKRLNETKPLKKVIIVKGGPGTGKSIIAVNLLVALTSNDLKPAEKKGMPCRYITKNEAPRNIYKARLKQNKVRRVKDIDFLFAGPSRMYLEKENTYACLIVDEAHRLQETGDRYSKGENQVKEIINASWVSVFFIDPLQHVAAQDFGTIEEIRKQAKAANAELIEFKLRSQFRCNGSDGYLSWVEEALDMDQNMYGKLDTNDFDFRVIDDPQTLHNLIREKNKINNRSRVVAGYCWDWPDESQHNPDFHDIIIDEGNIHYEASWNLKNTNYAIDKKSVDQIGCVHTVQGLEFDYVGVIIGKDLVFENGKVEAKYEGRSSQDATLSGLRHAKDEKGKSTSKPPTEEQVEEMNAIIKNTYRTLMTRGMKGCYIYCCDKALSNHFKDLLK